MAHGAPESVDDVPPYLDNIRYGLSTVPSIVEEVKRRYQLIGGKSPLLEITRNQAAALQSFLNQGGNRDLKVYFGMRNWRPYIRDVVKVIVEDGIRRLLAVCLAPQYSKLSTELYFDALREALKTCDADVEVRFITGWANHPLLIDAFVEKYQLALDHLRAQGREKIFTVFTVHSILQESVANGDPYLEEYDGTVRAIVERVEPLRWTKAFQSQGQRPGPWVGPAVESVLDRIARKGSKTVLIFPVGFVSDHIEILYDIDIGFKQYAVSKHLHLCRTESLNLSSQFIETLGSLVWEHLI